MKVVVLGGGLAGLSSAYELSRNGVDVTVLEKDPEVGGLAKSFSIDGFTIDLGPHRFHTKQDEIVDHLKELLGDNLVERDRISRIFLMNRFFDYPLKFSNALFTMPPLVTIRIMLDYMLIKVKNLFSKRPDDSFESWVTNRFGYTLYKIFFGEYTEKTWGIPCDKISADWASQRISLLSLWDTLVKTLFKFGETPRTYISRFYYPEKGGIGEICETYKRKIIENGGQIILNARAKNIILEGGKVSKVVYADGSGEKTIGCDHLFSTVPFTNMVNMMDPPSDKDLVLHASNLKFRSIMFVFIMVNTDKISDDHWIYLPEKYLLGNRLSESKNFSVYNAPGDKTVIGVEITCDFDDDVWNLKVGELTERVVEDLSEISFISKDDVIGSSEIHMKHAYPIYDLDYKIHMVPIKNYLDSISNLSYFGRNALFRYNNMDHSVDMGLKAAKNLLGKSVDYRHAATGNHWFG